MADSEPVTVCGCSGLLALVAGGFAHADVCIECYDAEGPCPDAGSHVDCGRPDPTVCLHERCDEVVSLDIECAYGETKRTCCGCCWVSADALEGRMLWPR